MVEKWIFAPGFNDAVLLRTLALCGRQSLGVRVTDGTELSQHALMRSGIPSGKTLLSQREAALMLKQHMTGEFFRFASLSDAQTLRDALTAARMLCVSDEREMLGSALENGPFPEKNREVLRVYDAYAADCEQRGVMDSIMLMRLCLRRAKPLRGTVIVPETVRLTPLEYALLTHLFGETGVQHVSLPALFGKEECPLSFGEISACCGASTEVRHIFAQIAMHRYPFDSCTVAVSDLTQYAPLFREIAAEYGVPAVIRTGVPLRETAPARLFQQILKWKEGFCGKDALRALLFCDALNLSAGLKAIGLSAYADDKKRLPALISLCGGLRLSMDATENQARIAACRAQSDDQETAALLDAAQSLCGLFEQGYAAILRTFSVIRNADDAAALRVLCNAAADCTAFDSAYTEDYLTALLDQPLGTNAPEFGALYVTDLTFAPEAMRKHMFLAGLSAELFPGSIPENYYLLDADLTAVSEAHAQTVDRMMMNRKADFEALVRLIDALSADAAFSYSAYHSAELKDENASSVLFALWNKARGGNAQIADFQREIRQIGYFAEPVSEIDSAGYRYIAEGGRKGSAQSPELSGMYTGERVFSPTKIEAFRDCPYQFMLRFLLKADVPEEDDVFTVIPANALGTLIHAQFETLADRDGMTEDAFCEAARAAFLAYCAERPPLHAELKEKTLSEITEMARHGFRMIQPGAVFCAEKDLCVLHEKSGITLKGTVDRAEYAPDGTLTVLDYKTGRRMKHLANDPESCIQTLLYAYMIEHAADCAGKKVSACKYLYLRDGAEIPCAPDEAAVDAVLTELRQSLDTGVFPRVKDDSCKYCAYRIICGALES